MVLRNKLPPGILDAARPRRPGPRIPAKRGRDGVAGHGARPGHWGQAAQEDLCTGTCFLSFLGPISGGPARENGRHVLRTASGPALRRRSLLRERLAMQLLLLPRCVCTSRPSPTSDEYSTNVLTCQVLDVGVLRATGARNGLSGIWEVLTCLRKRWRRRTLLACGFGVRDLTPYTRMQSTSTYPPSTNATSDCPEAG
jgi:hypothetical protein